MGPPLTAPGPSPLSGEFLLLLGRPGIKSGPASFSSSVGFCRLFDCTLSLASPLSDFRLCLLSAVVAGFQRRSSWSMYWDAGNLVVGSGIVGAWSLCLAWFLTRASSLSACLCWARSAVVVGFLTLSSWSMNGPAGILVAVGVSGSGSGCLSTPSYLSRWIGAGVGDPALLPPISSCCWYSTTLPVPSLFSSLSVIRPWVRFPPESWLSACCRPSTSLSAPPAQFPASPPFWASPPRTRPSLPKADIVTMYSPSPSARPCRRLSPAAGPHCRLSPRVRPSLMSLN